MNPDDAVKTSLNPTEDYKTSVLSGQSPTIIMECVGRAMSFWSYQMAQEILYQEHLARNLAERYNNLSTHFDDTVRESNDENAKLRGKLEST